MIDYFTAAFFYFLSDIMSDIMDLAALRDAVVNGRAEWLKHSLERMLERGISRADVKEALIKGEIIEDYPDDKPYPSALFMGLVENKPLHVVAAHDASSRFCMVITAYHPDLEHFEKDFKTRRKR